MANYASASPVLVLLLALLASVALPAKTVLAADLHNVQAPTAGCEALSSDVS